MPLRDGVFLPVAASQPPGSEATLAIIPVHGAWRNVDVAEPFAVAKKQQCKTDDTLVVTPLFGNSQCTAAQWNGGPDNQQAAVWSRNNIQ